MTHVRSTQLRFLGLRTRGVIIAGIAVVSLLAPPAMAYADTVPDEASTDATVTGVGPSVTDDPPAIGATADPSNLEVTDTDVMLGADRQLDENGDEKAELDAATSADRLARRLQDDAQRAEDAAQRSIDELGVDEPGYVESVEQARAKLMAARTALDAARTVQRDTSVSLRNAQAAYDAVEEAAVQVGAEQAEPTPTAPAAADEPVAEIGSVAAAEPLPTAAVLPEPVEPTAPAVLPEPAEPTDTVVLPEPVEPTDGVDPPETDGTDDPAAVRASDPEVFYESCSAAQAAGRSNIGRSEPGYRSPLDSDDDGIACESDPRNNASSEVVDGVEPVLAQEQGELAFTGAPIFPALAGGMILVGTGTGLLLASRRGRGRGRR